MTHLNAFFPKPPTIQAFANELQLNWYHLPCEVMNSKLIGRVCNLPKKKSVFFPMLFNYFKSLYITPATSGQTHQEMLLL